MYIFLWVCMSLGLHFSGTVGVLLMGYLKVACLVFNETAKLFSREVLSFYLHTSNPWVIWFLYILTWVYVVTFFFNFSHSARHVMVTHHGFNFISLVANDAEHCPMCWSAICISSLVKCLFMSFSHFLIGQFFFWSWFWEFFIYMSLSHMWFANIFFQVVFSFS